MVISLFYEARGHLSHLNTHQHYDNRKVLKLVLDEPDNLHVKKIQFLHQENDIFAAKKFFSKYINPRFSTAL